MLTFPSPLLSVALSALLGWGLWGSLFGDDPSVRPPNPTATAHALRAELLRPSAGAHLHDETRAVYGGRAPALLWETPAERVHLARALAAAPAEGIGPAEVRAAEVGALRAQLAAAEAEWTALDAEARDTLTDPRPVRLARLDLALTDGVLRLGDALGGQRVDPTALYPGTWFPASRDSAGTHRDALLRALRAGDAAGVTAALDALRPPHEGYRQLRDRLAALQEPLAPVPDGAPLHQGEHSVRVPHLRDRLTALGYLPDARLDAWHRPEPYAFDSTLAAALSRFQSASGLAADSVLDDATTEALNADPAELRRQLALNLERWRWLPDDFGDRFVWVNLPAFELRVMERPDSLSGPLDASYAERLRMPVNIGNALTTGWTTPVLTDSIHTLEFQPVWYVPRSLAASNIFPMARRDSLALWRSGIEAFQNGSPVDTRLVPWDSVSVSEFRFVQRPGPSNPLGRVKFMMHNPYAILIHDTNKRWSFDDAAGSTMSSGCVQAGAPDELAEYLLTTVNGWNEGAATAAWQRGPRRGVRLAEPVRTHFTYFTAWVDDDGALRLYSDPYGYDAPLADALGLSPPPPAS